MFQESFKYYKSKNPPPNLEDVTVGEQQKFKMMDKLKEHKFPGLKSSEKWDIYEIIDKPGLIIIKNPFTALGQKYWIAKCLQDYPQPPNHTNLPPTIYDKHVTNSDDINWWQIKHKIENPTERDKFTKALRWTTLGYHYDWTNKIYDEKQRNKFPDDLSELTSFCAKLLGFDDYKSEAAIVNYYPIGSTLSGHTDHSETNLEAPLFSFSFGQTAIFLIGGITKEEKPLALFLKSGDIIVMTKESRLCYHAVPRVFRSSEDPWNAPDEGEEGGDEANSSMDLNLWNLCKVKGFWCSFNDYINDSRINMNVRQVLNDGETHL